MAPRLRLRLHFDDGSYIGPGKADLLALIGETGSISAAAARMGMSYKRAWTLVEALNGMFAAPLVLAARGGAGGGGASLSDAGQAVLAAYGDLVAAATKAAAPATAALEALRRPVQP